MMQHLNSFRAFLLATILGLPIWTVAAPPPFEWVRTTASTWYDYSAGIAVDQNKMVYSAAMFRDATANQIVFKKFNAKGDLVNSLKVTQPHDIPYFFGGLQTNSLGLTFLADAGSYLLIGNKSYGQLVLAQMTTNLSWLWIERIGSGSPNESDQPLGLCMDYTGNIIVARGFQNVDYRGTTMASQGGDDLLLMKVRATDGSLVWMKRAGGTFKDYGNGAVADADGNIYVVGNFYSAPMNFSGLLLQNGGNGRNGFVAKYDKDGQPVWVKRVGNGANDSLNGVVLSSDGRIIIVGYASSTLSFAGSTITADSGFIASLDSDGNFRSLRSLGPTVKPQSISRDHEENFVIAGSIAGRGGTEIAVIKCSGNLSAVWSKTAGLTGPDTARQLAVSPLGEIFFSGTYFEAAQFDQLYIEGLGGQDAFVAKISSETTGIPIVTAQPQAQAVYLGTQATLSVAVTSTTPARYQWFFNGTALQNQTNATLVLNNVNQKSEGYYYVEITNDFGTTRSASALLLLRGKAPIQVTTLAGGVNGQPGYQDSARGTEARFNLPNTAALQPDGVLFIPDTGNHMIRILDPGGSVGTLSGKTTPGFENGPASAALFRSPLAVAIDSARDLYVADTDNNVIRKISAFGTRAVVTYAGTGQRGYKDGALAEAQFDFPNDLVIDATGNLFVSEFQNHTIRKVGADGRVTTVAGNGTAGYQDGIGTAAQFRFPSGLARDGNGNLYVAEWSNHTLRKITPAGVVTTLAGTPGQRGFVDGPGSSALLNTPDGVAVDAVGNLYFTEYGNHAVRRLGTDNVVTTIAGTGAPGFVNGDASQTMFRHPGGINITLDGSLVVVDTGNHAIRKITWNTAEPPPQPVAYISLHAGVTIFGVAGRKYQIEAAESAGPNAQWVVLGQLILSGPVQTWYDPQPASRKIRLYRVRELAN
jgi:hypothetical protein